LNAQLNRFAANLFLIAFGACAGSIRGAELLDFTRAVVVAPPNLSGPENKAIAMLIEEVEKRSQIRWQRVNAWPTDETPVIAIGQGFALKPIASGRWPKTVNEKGVAAHEGFSAWTDRVGSVPIALIAGNDARGVLYGAGWLLRKMEMTKRKILMPDLLPISTAPQTPLRGHQLGYRPKTNSYDGWTLAMWEQYIRDLVVFGCNAVELIPPRSDDAADSPHFPLPQMETMAGMSRILNDYGMDVWIWYPAMDKDYSDPGTVDFALKEWGEVFRKLPRIDAIFVPGGDPGHTQPNDLMSLLEKQSTNLRRYHPKAQMWVSPQSFNREWMDEFLSIVKREPAWLAGIVYGPQVRIPLPELRAAIPKKYPIRHYPDITHSRHCQYPVSDWDLAFSLTEGREVINPRPVGMARIYRLLQPYTCGFITYSEGCNDDVNKVIWSALGWDREADVGEVLREYARYFISPAWTDAFAQGLLALEKNWEAPALENKGIYATLQQFQSLERAETPQNKLNWRFQQALYRAYYDAYLRSRLIDETALEERALAHLREAPQTGSRLAMSRAEIVLQRASTDRAAADWRARVFELAEALYQSIRMQLSVVRYQAISVGRGANLDEIDVPLNNRLWLEQRFEQIRELKTEPERLAEIAGIVNWNNPGPGGFYDDLGDPGRRSHLELGPGFETDPAFFQSILTGFGDRSFAGSPLPISWWRFGETLYDTPLRMRYKDLNRQASYRLRVVYGRSGAGGKLRLLADDQIEIHPYLQEKAKVLEFDIPQEVTADGELLLTWFPEPGRGGNGRNLQIAEVWLTRK
jgi:hypothetical protein